MTKLNSFRVFTLWLNLFRPFGFFALLIFYSLVPQFVLAIEDNTLLEPNHALAIEEIENESEFENDSDKISGDPLWLLNMGMSNITFHENQYQSFKGSGPSLKLHLSLSPWMSFGLGFTSYMINNRINNESIWGYSQSGSGRSSLHQTITQEVVEARFEVIPIQYGISKDFDFNSFAFGGITDFAYLKDHPLFYGIGLGAKVYNSFGIRYDLISYVSRGSGSSLSLVGYF